jgi:hypothetical protein
MGIFNGLALLTIALLLRCGMIAVRRLAGRAALTVPVCVRSTYSHSRARARLMAIEASSLSLRAPPTLPAQRRHVSSGISLAGLTIE